MYRLTENIYALDDKGVLRLMGRVSVQPAPNAELVSVFPLSAAEALRRAMALPPPGDDGAAGRQTKG